jgi:site-specific DNA-methyltransferase (cytosine-N4-specific)
MPESVTDRCTKSHEYLFLLTKQARYYFDAEAIAEPSNHTDWPMMGRATHQARREKIAGGELQPMETRPARNRRSVWTIATQPYSAAHFATFPESLVKPCILAGSRPGDLVLDPFLGSGTVAKVAQDLGRQWVGCELNPEYAKLIEERTRQQGLTLMEAP